MKRKQVFTIVLTLILIISMVQPIQVSAATKLNKSRATLEVGATIQLKLGSIKASNVVWKTENKVIASVSTEGLVTAKKEGTVTITATYNKKDYACKVTVVDSNKGSVTLTAGQYIVGEDIEPGKYDVECIFNYSAVWIYDSESNYLKDNLDIIKAIALMDENSSLYEALSSMYSPNYKNLKLKKGNYIVIDSNCEMEFTVK